MMCSWLIKTYDCCENDVFVQYSDNSCWYYPKILHVILHSTTYEVVVCIIRKYCKYGLQP